MDNRHDERRFPVFSEVLHFPVYSVFEFCSEALLHIAEGLKDFRLFGSRLLTKRKILLVSLLDATGSSVTAVDIDSITEDGRLSGLENSGFEPWPGDIEYARVAVADKPGGREAGVVGRDKYRYAEFFDRYVRPAERHIRGVFF